MHGCNCSIKKLPSLEEMDGSSLSSKRNQYGHKMNDQSLLLFSNIITEYFTELTTPSHVLEKIFCLQKYLILQKDLLNSS